MDGTTWKIIEMKFFYPTGNDISQFFKVSAKKLKKRSHSAYPIHIAVRNSVKGGINETALFCKEQEILEIKHEIEV